MNADPSAVEGGDIFAQEPPQPVERTCVVAEGTAIYANPVSFDCSTAEPPPFFGRTEDELRACANAWLDKATDYQASINGHDVGDLEAYRSSSPLFTLTFPENNLFGAEPVVAQAVSAAYSFIIAPPPPGEYKIALTTRYRRTHGDDSQHGQPHRRSTRGDRATDDLRAAPICRWS